MSNQPATEPDEDEAREKAIRELAEAHVTEGELEIDDGATISEGDDNGAYVQAWVWVSFVGTPLDKDKEPTDKN